MRPEFTDTLAVKQSRHPIMEKVSYEPLIPNNIVSELHVGLQIIHT